MTSFLLGLRICKLNLQYRKQCELETGLLSTFFYILPFGVANNTLLMCAILASFTNSLNLGLFGY